jgi:hypothetical protein
MCARSHTVAGCCAHVQWAPRTVASVRDMPRHAIILPIKLACSGGEVHVAPAPLVLVPRAYLVL